MKLRPWCPGRYPRGANGLSLTEVAHRLGVRSPSVLTYCASIIAGYHAHVPPVLVEQLGVLRAGPATGPSGLDALTEGLETSTSSQEMVRIQREALTGAVGAGQLCSTAHGDEVVFLASILITGALTRSSANQPELRWGKGWCTPLFPLVTGQLADSYPPE